MRGVDLSLQSSSSTSSKQKRSKTLLVCSTPHTPSPHHITSPPHHTHTTTTLHPHTQDRCYRSAAELQVAGCPMFAHRAPSLHHHHYSTTIGSRPAPSSTPQPVIPTKILPFYWTGPGHSCEPYSIQNRRGTTPASVTVIGLSTQVTTATGENIASVCRLMPRGEVSCDSQQSSLGKPVQYLTISGRERRSRH